MRRVLLLLFLIVCSAQAFAQVPTDGLMMPANSLCTGFMYQHDSWKEYWEGSRKRANGNIGTFTSQNIMWYGVYGLTPKINLMASVPYVTTKSNAGTLHGMQGVQDLMVSGKYKLIETEAGPGKFYTFAVASFSTPLSDYTPDFLPYSIGLHTTNVAGRVNLNYTTKWGVYLNTSGGYTWRSNTKLDRPSYYTDDTFYSTNEVQMPNVLDFKLDLGYHKGALQVEASYMQMNTQGGGDIRRQDMPFPSNRMNAKRIGALVMYYVPFVKNLGVRGMVNYTLDGRNVGQTTSIMGGLLYTFYFKGQPEPKTPTDNQ